MIFEREQIPTDPLRRAVWMRTRFPRIIRAIGNSMIEQNWEALNNNYDLEWLLSDAIGFHPSYDTSACTLDEALMYMVFAAHLLIVGDEIA